jgi:hypothetical protein
MKPFQARVARWKLEQQSKQPAVRQAQQQRTDEYEQQHRFSLFAIHFLVV